MARSVFVFKCIPFLSRWSASGVAGECACLYLCVLACLCGVSPASAWKTAPFLPAPSGHLRLGNSDGLLDFSAQDCPLHSLAWPLNCS